ncbi:Uncharacterised protein g8046 [Pycnogonum litorale]
MYRRGDSFTFGCDLFTLGFRCWTRWVKQIQSMKLPHQTVDWKLVCMLRILTSNTMRVHHTIVTYIFTLAKNTIILRYENKEINAIIFAKITVHSLSGVGLDSTMDEAERLVDSDVLLNKQYIVQRLNSGHRK